MALITNLTSLLPPRAHERGDMDRELQTTLLDLLALAVRSAPRIRVLLAQVIEAATDTPSEPAVATAATPASDECHIRSIDSRLSPREREVLALVAEGHSNKAIAEVLFVAPSTVKTHVTSLLTKLKADNRVQLATIAVQRGLLTGV